MGKKPEVAFAMIVKSRFEDEDDLVGTTLRRVDDIVSKQGDLNKANELLRKGMDELKEDHQKLISESALKAIQAVNTLLDNIDRLKRYLK